jgi:hypothetical protein
MRLGWLAPAAFLFGRTFFAADLRRILADELKTTKQLAACKISWLRTGVPVWDGFSRGFHRICSGFTASAQIILRFALYSLMLKWANRSQW